MALQRPSLSCVHFSFRIESNLNMFYVFIATELSIKMEKDRIIWAVDFIFDCDIRKCSCSFCYGWLYWAHSMSWSPPLSIQVYVPIQESEHLCILHFTFLFSLFVFVSAAGHYFRIWTGQVNIIILDKKYNIANSSYPQCHELLLYFRDIVNFKSGL